MSVEIKANDRRIEVVDYLKGFSIFTIALMHLMMMMSGVPSILMKMASIGGTGVHVFFLCSGIGLYMSYLRKKTNYIEFIKKRFTKIYVPYIIIVLVSFFAPWMYRSDRIYALLSHVFLYKMFIPKYEESFGVHFWFISTIIQFYLVFIPMCRIKEKVKNNIVFIVIFSVISISWWIFCFLYGVTDLRVWNSFFLQYIWEFAIGMVIADEVYHGRVFRINGVILFAFMVVGIGLQAVMAAKSETLKIFNDPFGLIGYTSLALLVMMIPVIKQCALWLSRISYEYFLVHILVFTPIIHMVKDQNLIIQCMVGVIAICVAMAIAYFYNKLIQMINAKISS